MPGRFRVTPAWAGAGDALACAGGMLMGVLLSAGAAATMQGIVHAACGLTSVMAPAGAEHRILNKI